MTKLSTLGDLIRKQSISCEKFFASIKLRQHGFTDFRTKLLNSDKKITTPDKNNL